MSQLSNSLIGQQVAGYHLTALLGVGGMAKVYRAHDVELGREVAVKIVTGPQATDEAYVQRFRNEARRIAALTHPNIVPIYHFGEDRGSLFLVMPIVAESLRERLDREHILPLQQAAHYVIQIAAALQWAHSQGIVHRDVKPENILLDRTDVALLTDFGIAREAAVLRQMGAKRTLSPTGLPVGTPEYMAPEQLQAHTVDHRSDVYALGAVLYELITGTTPHAAATPYAVAVRVLTEPLTPPSQHNSHIPRELEQVVLRALALSPDDRYQDMAGFAEALTATSQASASSDHSATVQSGSPRQFDYLQEVQNAATEPLHRHRSATEIRQASKLSSNRWLVASALVALLVLSGTGILLVSHLPPSSNQLASHGNVQTSTSSPGSYTAIPSRDTRVASPQLTATAQASRTPGAMTTPTIPTTFSPTPSPGSPTSTATPISAMSLELNPATQVMLSQQGQTCSGNQTIMNVNAFAVSWQWTATSPQISNVQFQTSGSGWSSGLPSGMLAANSSTTLSLSLDCNSEQDDAITMTDNQGNMYSFSLLS